jgi:MFS family permease
VIRRTVTCLGLSQLISWGVSYYLIGVFGEAIAAEFGWGRDVVYGGFALSLLVMGLASPMSGQLIDRLGGRKVMVAGSILNAAGCAGLGLCHGLTSYFLAWTCLGIGMRLTLYDAAFAALARIRGPLARSPISQITLLGGLASTIFWPVGHFLSEQFGWRQALFAYAGFALMTVPLHLVISNGRHEDLVKPEAASQRPPLATTKRQLLIAGGLYAVVATMANFLNAGMSAHMIGILGGLGVATTLSVWIATLRGVGQSSARLCEILLGRRIDPLALNLLACLLMPLSFVAGLDSGASEAAAVVFALVYGACNGVLTITRGTLPLVLFENRTYGAFVGKLVAPSFILSAAAPLVYAWLIDHFGERWGLHVSTVCAAMMLAAALLLSRMFRKPKIDSNIRSENVS